MENDIDAVFLSGLFGLIPDALKGSFLFLVDSLRDIGLAEFSVSVVALLWSASRSMLGLLEGLNNIAGIRDTHNFLFKRLLCLLYTVLLMAGLLLTLGLRVFGHLILGFLQKSFPYIGSIFSLLMDFRGLTLSLLLTLTIAAVYALFPNKKMNFLRQLPGAAVAAAAWLLFSAFYSWYVQYLSSSSALYGGMGIAILAMLWVYFCIYILFVGALLCKLYPDWLRQLWQKIRKQ